MSRPPNPSGVVAIGVIISISASNSVYHIKTCMDEIASITKKTRSARMLIRCPVCNVAFDVEDDLHLDLHLYSSCMRWVPVPSSSVFVRITDHVDGRCANSPTGQQNWPTVCRIRGLCEPAWFFEEQEPRLCPQRHPGVRVQEWQPILSPV